MTAIGWHGGRTHRVPHAKVRDCAAGEGYGLGRLKPAAGTIARPVVLRVSNSVRFRRLMRHSRAV
jgi:hypothetical protein